MPTSLCSGQVARLIAEDLDANPPPWSDVSRFVALVHTEGCGSNNAADLHLRTLLGHLVHRSVRHAILLEHGCEQTHNDAVRRYLAERGLPADRFGWASVQMDGGIAKVRAKVAGQLEAMAARARVRNRGYRRRRGPGMRKHHRTRIRAAPPPRPAGGVRASSGGGRGRERARRPHRGRPAAGGDGRGVRPARGRLDRGRRDGGGTRQRRASRVRCVPGRGVSGRRGCAAPASLSFGQPAEEAGFHVMEAPTENPVETFTGLGATGAEVMLCHVGRTTLQAHPMIPLVQVTADPSLAERCGGDLDRAITLDRDADGLVAELAGLVADVASRRYHPKLWARGVTEFQLTRGRLGLSM